MTGLRPERREAVERWFQDNFTSRGELGASVSIWCDGQETLTLGQGFANRERTKVWTTDTLVPVWSATKGPAAVACLMALHEAGLPLNSPVAEVWPEFFLGGKESVTFAQLLSHRAGLSAMTQRVPIFDYNAVIDALEHQTPLWPDAPRQAYHARTFGFLLDEIVRRITGMESLGHYFDEMFGRPLDLDFWIGLPPEQHHRVATIYPGKMNLSAGDQAFMRAYTAPGSITHQTFNSPVGLSAVQDFNQAHTWVQGFASMGGVGNARALAKFYSIFANGGKWQGVQIVPTWIQQALMKPLTAAIDEVLCVPIAFSAGMMMDPINDETNGKIRSLFGPSESAFGHPGAGGSVAFADPDTGISFAYVMNQMEVGVLPSEKALGLVRAVFGSGS